MKFKYYFGASLFFIIILGLYVYSLSGYSYSYNVPFMDSVITLPIAVWFVIPIFLFFIVVVFLEIGGSFRLWQKRQAYKNDYKLLLTQIESQILNKEFPLKQPKMNRYKALSIILHNLTFDIKDGVPLKSGDERLDELIALLGDVKRGEYVNLKKFNPNNDSSFIRQNTLNEIHIDNKFAIEVLKKSIYKDEIKLEAFKKLLETEPNDAKRFLNEVKFDKNTADFVMELCKAGKIDLSNEEIAKICMSVGYSKDNYVSLAHKLKERYEPPVWVGIFESLSSKDENAELSYMYVLLELEMIDEAKERLNTHAQNEFINLRAYMDLKTLGKKYPLELFLKL
ncbi:hypothetical protein [Helicobacter sp. WB40]|uniref:hypothetical protein n=1 Tax=Helicobacter sp. WB40 TaxID=3004130 RepID=UPI0022EBAF1B|nr:hypothetical protein [Helicobacter sp. WB40]MDA3966959.1 hypothetical protein [Helicobacter sp. WB40]